MVARGRGDRVPSNRKPANSEIKTKERPAPNSNGYGSYTWHPAKFAPVPDFMVIECPKIFRRFCMA